MTVQTGLGIEGALVGDADLIDGVVVDLLGVLGLQQVAGGHRVEGQSHEDTVEPYLVAVDGFVPKHFVLIGTGLVLQLLHQCLDGQQVLLLRIELVHTGHEMTGTDLIEVVVLDVVGADLALGVDHRVGILLTVFANVLTSIFKIGVEHRLQFDTHHITPLRSDGEVEQITLRHTLHFGIGEPLGIVLVGGFQQRQTAVDIEVVVINIARLAAHVITILHTIEVAVLDEDIIDIGILLEADDLYTVLRLLTGHILHIDITHGGVVATAADLIMLIVKVDLQDTLLADTHLDILHVDVLDDTTTTAVGLDAEHALQLRGVHHTVMGIDILATARNL